jgi:hypothetical protein
MRMIGRVGLLLVAGALASAGAPAFAQDEDSPYGDGTTAELPAYLQCVPYARQVSGIQIYGDAWTWWDQAAGR